MVKLEPQSCPVKRTFSRVSEDVQKDWKKEGIGERTVTNLRGKQKPKKSSKLKKRRLTETKEERRCRKKNTKRSVLNEPTARLLEVPLGNSLFLPMPRCWWGKADEKSPPKYWEAYSLIEHASVRAGFDSRACQWWYLNKSLSGYEKISRGTG